MFWLGKSLETEITDEIGKITKESLSPLEVLILAQLRSREIRNDNSPVGQYGYEMIQDLNELFAGSWEAKSGTIYPILSKLEGKKKMIIGDRKKSPLGPVKKVYILRDSGRYLIDKIIQENFDADLNFILQYINLIAPFLHNAQNETAAEQIYDKLLSIPGNITTLAMREPKTDVDKRIRKKKLETLKENLEIILKNIDNELKSK